MYVDSNIFVLAALDTEEKEKMQEDL